MTLTYKKQPYFIDQNFGGNQMLNYKVIVELKIAKSDAVHEAIAKNSSLAFIKEDETNLYYESENNFPFTLCSLKILRKTLKLRKPMIQI